MFFKTRTVLGLRDIFFKKFFESTQNYSFEEYVDLFRQIVANFRPINPQDVEVVSIKQLLDFLEENNFLLDNFKNRFYSHTVNKKINYILTNDGILDNQNFFSEVKRRLNYKLIPNQPNKDTLDYLLNNVFYESSDPIWINKIPKEELRKLFSFLSSNTFYQLNQPMTKYAQLLRSLDQLAKRCSGRAHEYDVLQMVPGYEDRENPFDTLQRELHEIIDKVYKKPRGEQFLSSDDQNYKQLLIIHNQCFKFIDKAFTNAHKFGISLSVNQSLLRIRQQLHRMRVLFPILIVNNEQDKIDNPIQLVIKLIKYNCQKNNIRSLVDESTQLISYEITQHTAKTGEKYITETKTEYFNMLKAALGGGFIVAILCVIKLLFSKIPASDFGYAFLYSINYSLGFIIIYVLGFTLATKQPAMTATTLVLALEEGMKKKINMAEKHLSFAKLFARLFRSQFIAFVGNVVMAFPVALLLILLIDLVFNYNVAETKWEKLILDLSPVHSSAIFHAAIAGVFLFISGLIAGSQSNRFKFSNLYYRIAEHPQLIQIFGRAFTKKMSTLLEKKGPGVISNFWFGVFLGSTASVGAFLGLDLDIRHITFAAGNLALGLYGNSFDVSITFILLGVLGVGLIGFANFIVSFTLALLLAMRSRSIPLKELLIIGSSVWYYFKTKPKKFFFPVND